MIQIDHSKTIYGVKNYIKENWGFPFIMGFMFLLVGAAISLSLGLFSLADNIAVFAFYALVIGVISQIICFLKYKKSEAEAQ
jgi:hypothetical protein